MALDVIYVLLLLLNSFRSVVSISWYKNFGTPIDDPKCMENNQPIVEYYKIDEYQYMFFSERVSWDEAKTICPIYDAQLAIVDTRAKANKLAAAIAESNIDMEDIWIGGERSDKGNWTWNDKQQIPTETVNGYPPWVRSPDRPWKQCLAMDRFTVNTPLFVDLDCRLPKPFICQREIDAPANPDITLPSHMVTIGKSTFILYHARVTWGSAAAFCRMRGYRLAIIPNNKMAKIVSTAMIRSRPSFENAWLSGHFSRKKWRWLSTGESFSSFPDKNNYPPWHHNSTNKKSGCVLLDRHVCDDPVFLAPACDRKRDFICEKYDKKAKPVDVDEPIQILYQGWTMILFLKPLSWYDAEKSCYDFYAHLTEVYDYDMMKTITTAMSDQESEPVHVWLGGILINNTWTWKYSNKPIPIKTDTTGFMPWCDMDDRNDNNCLNMDREAHDKPAVYGLRCKLKQPFVCTKNQHVYYIGNDEGYSVDTPTALTTVAKTTMKPTTTTRTTTTAAPQTTTATRKTTTATPKTTTATPTTTTATPKTTTATPKTTTATPKTTTATPTTTTATPKTTTATPKTTTATPKTTTATPTTTTATPKTTTATPKTTTATPTTTTATPKTTTATPTTTTTTPKTTTATPKTTTSTPKTTTATPTTTTATPKTTTATPKTTTATPTTTTTKTTTSTTIKATTKFKECNQQPIILTLPKGKIYVSFFSRITFEGAQLLCTQAGGELAKVTSDELGPLVKELRTHAARCAARHLWIHTAENCTYIRYDNGKALHSRTCNSKKGYVCEINCSNSLPESSLFNNNLWSCSTEEDNKICSVSCKSGSILEGTDSVMCSTAGWVDAYNKTSLLPICQDIFMIDEVNIKHDFRASPTFRMGLIKYHSSTTTAIPLNATDTCTILEALHKLRPEPNPEFSFYNLALEEAEKQINLLPPKEKVVMILITTGINHGNEYGNIVKRLKNHKIFCIGIGEEPNEDIGMLASVMNDKFLLYKFQNFISLDHVTSRITSQRSKKLDCPERLYVMPKNSLCHQDSISINNYGNTYTAFFTPITYLGAQTKCYDAGGRLVDTKNKDLQAVVNKVMKTAKACPAVELWINGGDLPCATMEISYKERRSELPNCTAMHGQLCEISCADHPKESKYSKNIWNCTKSANSQTCNVQCMGDAVLEGTESIKCTSNGWTTINNQITYFPICLNDRDVARNIKFTIKELIQETDGFLFLIDTSGFNPKAGRNPLEVVTSIIKVHPVSTRYPMGLLTFNEQVEVVIPYKATNTCTVLNQIKELHLEPEKNIKRTVHYNKILQEARHHIFKYQSKTHTVIFFVTDRFSTEDTFIRTAKTLKERHTIICMGINSHIMSDLNSLASMFNDKLLQYKFNNYRSYETVMKIIGKTKSSLLEC